MCCPLMINISPGTTSPKLREVRPLLASSISSKCMNTPIIRMIKQLLIFIITLEKIWLTRMLPIIRLKPSIIPMQKILGKFYFDSTPNTPQNQSKERSLPPKKYPNHMKLNPIKKLNMKTLRKRGSDGVSYLSEKQTLMADPIIDSRSPMTLDRLEYERYRSFILPIATSPVIESYSIRPTPTTINIVPALQNQWQPFFQIIFLTTKNRLCMLIRLKV